MAEYSIDLIPEVSDVDLAFSTQGTNKDLLAIAKSHGFYNGDSKWNKAFSSLFFGGGRIETSRKIPEDDKQKMIRYFKSLASSFQPKHEEKEAVCALLLMWLAGE